jgi:hypothetical protein
MTGNTKWPEPDARWIWIGKAKSGWNQYVEFSRFFRMMKENGTYWARISVDSDYELWVNGALAGWNQFPNWPKHKTFNSHDVTGRVISGNNCISVRVYYRGENFSTYAKGRPALIFALSLAEHTLLKSDCSWRCRLSKSYQSGRMPKVSPQLGFTIQYDARGEDNWQLPRYKEGRNWQTVTELAGPTDGYWQSLQPRPLPPLAVESPRPAALIASGYLIRDREHKRVAQTMREDALITAPLAEQLNYEGIFTNTRLLKLPQPDHKPLTIPKPPRDLGVYLVFDLGGEETGFFHFDIEAPGGTVVDIGHGEHLDDLRVRTCIGVRNFADRYVCRAGRQQWLQTYRRLGCRYLQLHIPKLSGTVKIYHATLRPVHYPSRTRRIF